MAKPTTKELQTLMNNLGISEEEALELWACDHDEAENEEQNELQKVASKVKIDHDVVNKSKGEKKVVTRKVSDEKVELFTKVLNALADYAPTIEKEHQTIGVECGGKHYSINFVEHRPKKK